MRGCTLRKVVRNLAHKKLENRGVADSPNRAAAPACVSHCFSHKQWLAQEVAEDAEDAEFCRGLAVYMAGGSGSRTPKMTRRMTRSRKGYQTEDLTPRSLSVLELEQTVRTSSDA